MSATRGHGVFDRRLVGGLLAMALVALATSVVAVFATRRILPPENASVRGTRFEQALELQSLANRKALLAPLYLLSGQRPNHDQFESTRRELRQALGHRLLYEPERDGRLLIQEVLRAQARHDDGLERAFAVSRREGPAAAAAFYSAQVAPLRGRFLDAMDAYVRYSTEALSPAQSVLQDRIVRMRRWILAVATVAFLLLAGMMLGLRGTLLGLYAAEAEQSAAAAAAREATESLARSQAEAHESTRRILNQLRASEAEFRAAFESAGIGHAQVEIPGGTIRLVNPKLCEMAGCRAEELTATPLGALLEDDGSGWFEEVARGAGGRPWREAQLRRRDGTRLAVHVTATMIRDPDGAPWRVLAVIQDLSELRRAQSALQATEERFHRLADSAPVLIWMSDPAARTTWVNRPWREFRDTTLAGEIRDGWQAGIHPDDRPAYDRAAEAALRAGEPFSAEFRLRRSDGEWRWMLSHGVPLRGPAGDPGGAIGSCVDITDRKRQEEQRERLLESERHARTEAERASRIKDEFLATLSHELRTPLQAMLGWSRLLATGQLDAEQTRRGLEVIERNVTLQKRLIEDLLDMSRIVQGKMRLEVMPLDPRVVVDAAVEVVRPAADARLTRLTVTHHPGVGPVLGDAQRLQQAVWNLLSNAIKFTPPGGGVDVRVERRDEHVRIRVRDTGQGIAPEFLPFVFERFRQQDASTTRTHSGLGLGLAIVRNLVELHGGRVAAESDGPGRGATFTIELPIAHTRPAEAFAPAAPVPGRSDAAAASPAPADTRLAGVHALIVDDEPDTRELLVRVLRESGAEVRAARSTGEALEMLAAERPDVLVSDIGMPGRDGYDLIRSLRAREGSGPRLPAIALTAFVRPEDARRALDEGFEQHLAKPIEPHELTTAVLRLVGERARQGAA